MVQAILGTRANLVGQGAAVGEPLGTRQVAVMILGFVPICCRIPARRLCLGKSPVPGVESWQVPGGVQALARCTTVRVGLWSQGRDYCLWATVFKPRRRKLGGNKIIWPGPILGLVLWHRLPGNSGFTLEFQGWDVRRQQRILIRHEENPTAIDEFSGLRSRGQV